MEIVLIGGEVWVFLILILVTMASVFYAGLAVGASFQTPERMVSRDESRKRIIELLELRYGLTVERRSYE